MSVRLVCDKCRGFVRIVEIGEWRVDTAGGRVWWDHKTREDVERVWLNPDGTFFFNNRDGDISEFDRFADAAVAAIEEADK